MKLHLRVVGKLKSRGLVEYERGFLDRMRGRDPLEVREFRSQEAALQKPAGPLVILDERGAQPSSPELAGWLRDYQHAGHGAVTFVIGDAHGFTDEQRAGADRVLALSRLTLPHRLARIVTVEQLYRACMILEGHPYHHV